MASGGFHKQPMSRVVRFQSSAARERFEHAEMFLESELVFAAGPRGRFAEDGEPFGQSCRQGDGGRTERIRMAVDDGGRFQTAVLIGHAGVEWQTGDAAPFGLRVDRGLGLSGGRRRRFHVGIGLGRVHWRGSVGAGVQCRGGERFAIGGPQGKDDPNLLGGRLWNGVEVPQFHVQMRFRARIQQAMGRLE